MEFIPRLTRYECGDIQGDIANLPWYKYAYGTKLFNVPLPNCTTYAYGRVMEQYKMNGYDLDVRTESYNPYWWNRTGTHFGNANTWYNSRDNIWEKGSVAKLGAIACWNHNQGGHVAIVEVVHPDGSVDLSESHYGGAMFNYAPNQRLVVGQYDSRIQGTFQGYIYVPLSYSGGSKYIFYRRGNYVKIINYGRATSTGRLPIAKGVGWKRYVLRVFKNREYPIQVGDIKTGATTGFYKHISMFAS